MDFLKGDLYMFEGTNFIWVLVLGALSGWIASMIVGKDAQMGGVANIITGIVGSVIGGWIYNAFNANGSANASTFSVILWSVIGAVILLAIINLITNNRNNNGINNRRPRR